MTRRPASPPRGDRQFVIDPVDSNDGFDQAGRLIQEYVDSLHVDVGYEQLDHELATLPTMYGPPKGRLFLAHQGSDLVGCAGLRRWDDGRGEMKRVYVRPAFRGRGLGRRLVESVLAEARTIGYRSVVLDTLPTMAAATALYVTLGFREIPPYYHSPIRGTRYFERTMSGPTP